MTSETTFPTEELSSQLAAVGFDGKALATLTALAPRQGPVIMTDSSFAEFFFYQDRESYLAWVAQWKALYRALSAEIRQQKRAVRKADNDATWQQRHALWQNQRLARALLALRAAAKRDSWQRATAVRAGAMPAGAEAVSMAV